MSGLSNIVSASGCELGYRRGVCRSESAVQRGTFVSGAFVLLMILYTFAALVQELLPFSLNRVLGAAIVVVLGYDFLTRFSAKRALTVCAVGLLFVVNVGILTTDRSEELEFYIYWVAALLILCYVGSDGVISDIRGVVTRHGSAVGVCVMASALLVVTLLVTHTGYESQWGGGLYFSGFCNTEHTMASVCCLVMSLAYLCERTGGLRSWVVFPILGVMSWAVMQTGARTFLVPVAVIWILFVRESVSRRWLRLLIYAVLVAIVVYAFAFTGMASKFDYLADISVNTDSFISAMTSGRNEYWMTDLSAWAGRGPFVWVLGGSAAAVYDINWATFHMRIWSHDDFVMLICSVGIVGLLLYIAALKSFFNSVERRVGQLAFLLTLLFVLFPAFINGFYLSQHLVYASVFLVCATAEIEKNTPIIPSIR